MSSFESISPLLSASIWSKIAFARSIPPESPRVYKVSSVGARLEAATGIAAQFTL